MPDDVALRLQAQAVRTLAARLDASAVRGLGSLAGPETWVGPSAQVLGRDLTRALARLDAAVLELRALARSLDARAAMAERHTGP